jgi:hypothetical protein
MNQNRTPSLGELITLLYDEYMAIYGDEDLASVATAATINDLLMDGTAPSRGDPLLAEADAA